jgi:hypothetical protein
MYNKQVGIPFPTELASGLPIVFMSTLPNATTTKHSENLKTIVEVDAQLYT